MENRIGGVIKNQPLANNNQRSTTENEQLEFGHNQAGVVNASSHVDSIGNPSRCYDSGLITDQSASGKKLSDRKIHDPKMPSTCQDVSGEGHPAPLSNSIFVPDGEELVTSSEEDRSDMIFGLATRQWRERANQQLPERPVRNPHYMRYMTFRQLYKEG